MRHKTSRFVGAVALVTASLPFTASAQVRREPGTPRTVTLTIDLTIGTDAVKASGPGVCTHAPQASIYGIRSEMWTARHQRDGESVQLTLWRPGDKSPDMFGLQARGINVSTVRGGQPAGSGTVTMEPAGKGATFRIQAKGADGRAVSGTIKCEAFLPHVAEGG